MIVVIAIGWVLVIPMLVVGGLYLAPRLLGSRVRETGAIEVTAIMHDLAAFAGTALPAEEPQVETPAALVTDRAG